MTKIYMYKIYEALRRHYQNRGAGESARRRDDGVVVTNFFCANREMQTLFRPVIGVFLSQRRFYIPPRIYRRV